MKNSRHSIDGFVPRRPSSQLGAQQLTGVTSGSHTTATTGLSSISAQGDATRPRVGITRHEIDESLRGIDADGFDEPRKKLSRRARRRASQPHKSRVKRIIKWVLILLAIAVVGYLGVIAYKAVVAGGNIFQGNILNIFQNQPLKQDSNGRSNILILGTSEDDPGHEGGNLTDSMMILSIDQTKKNAYMISIPRDLYVKYHQACASGYEGKINVYYSCVGGDGTSVDQDRKALTKTSDFVGQIFGLDIQYGVNVNYTVMRDLVNAVGGITVTIDSRDPRGQMDSNFDWKCGATTYQRIKNCPPNGHYIDYPNGPVHLDAEHALYLAQARGDAAPTYGFEQSNFDREKNQQKIIKAIRDKAMSVGILTDFGKVTGIIDSLGNNLRTTFQASEVKTLVSLAKDIKDNDIKSISLIDGNTPVMATDMVSGQSVVVPAAGTYDYSQLQELIQKQLSSNPVTREGANVAVYNGSGVSGVAQTEADSLTTKGYNVTTIANAPEGNYRNVDIYELGSDKPATKAALEHMFNVKVKTSDPPVTVTGETDFVIIVGKAPANSSSN